MIYINLLPWREYANNEAKKEFIKHSILASVVGLTILIVWFLTNIGFIEQQLSINSRIEAATKVQQAKIVEIKDLKDEIVILLERKKVVESLQNNRNQATRILEQLSLRLPVGIQLKSISQKENIIKLNGIAQNNSLISKMMSDLSKSDWFVNPVLVEAKSVEVKVGNSNIKASEFILNITYKNPDELTLNSVESKKGGSK